METQISPDSYLSEGDGQSTGTAAPDSFTSGVYGSRGAGNVPNTPKEVEGFGFEGMANRSPFYQMLRSRIQERKQQEKTSMFNAAVLHAFQDELGHIQREKRANALAAIGKSLVGAGLKNQATRGMTSSVMGAARRVAGSTAGGQKLLGGTALGAAGLGAAGLGAAAS